MSDDLPTGVIVGTATITPGPAQPLWATNGTYQKAPQAAQAQADAATCLVPAVLNPLQR